MQERYRIIKKIGKGGYCQTFLAVDEGEYPPISCIVQKLELKNQSLTELWQKAKLIKELSAHPQIPCLLDSFTANNYFYFIYEYINGKNLAEFLTEVDIVAEIKIWQLLENILPILSYIHSYGVIHGDIKPENIIIKSNNFDNQSLVLVDFSKKKT